MVLALDKKKPSLGIGIYSIPDVAQIFNLEQHLVRRWIKSYWNSTHKNNNATASWGKGREKAIHFYTLIEFYVFYQLRKEGFTAQSIVKSHIDISEQLKTPFPFATSTILTDGKRVFYSADADTIISADKSKQINFKGIIEHFCKKIDFDNDSLAMRFWPLGKERNIVVDPHHQFGRPTIGNTNILAETIYRMHVAGEKISFISSLYDINEQDVKASIDFFNNAA